MSATDQDASRALTAAIASYVIGIGTIAAPYIFRFRVESAEVLLVLAVVTFLLNTTAVVLGSRARRTELAVGKAWAAIALGILGFIGSAVLFMSYLMSGLATP